MSAVVIIGIKRFSKDSPKNINPISQPSNAKRVTPSKVPAIPIKIDTAILSLTPRVNSHSLFSNCIFRKINFKYFKLLFGLYFVTHLHCSIINNFKIIKYLKKSRFYHTKLLFLKYLD